MIYQQIGLPETTTNNEVSFLLREVFFPQKRPHHICLVHCIHALYCTLYNVGLSQTNVLYREKLTLSVSNLIKLAINPLITLIICRNPTLSVGNAGVLRKI